MEPTWGCEGVNNKSSSEGPALKRVTPWTFTCCPLQTTRGPPSFLTVLPGGQTDRRTEGVWSFHWLNHRKNKTKQSKVPQAPTLAVSLPSFGLKSQHDVGVCLCLSVHSSVPGLLRVERHSWCVWIELQEVYGLFMSITSRVSSLSEHVCSCLTLRNTELEGPGLYSHLFLYSFYDWWEFPDNSYN